MPVLADPLDAVRREAEREQTRALWIDLHARLRLARAELATDRARGMLRRSGVRRPDTAVRQLERALSDATRLASSMGLMAPEIAVHRRVGELARPQDYRQHLRQLQDTCEALLRNAAVPRWMHRWLRTRIDVHAFQLEDLGTLEAIGVLPPR